MNPDQLLLRQQVRQQVKSCTSCDLHKSCKSPVPFSGPTPNPIAVIGEAPGKQEDRTGKPFVGPAGQLLREIMFDVGLNANEITFLNTVCCYPGRTPEPNEIAACMDNLKAQIRVIQPKWILLTGKVASTILRIREDLPLSKIRGMWYNFNGMWCMVTYHPSAYLRSKDPSIHWAIRQDLEALKFYSVGVFEPEQAQWCVKCDRDIVTSMGRLAQIWEGGVGYCMEHAGGRRIKKWNKTNQERMI